MDNDEVHRIAKALADPRRIEILRLLAEHGEITCGGMAELLPISQPTVSHHLRELINANLVTVRVDGQSHVFSLCKKTVELYTQDLAARLLGGN